MTTSSTADTTVSLSTMLKRTVIDAEEKSLGRLEDATTLLRDGQYPLLTGLVICVDGSRFFVPANSVISIAADPIRLRTAHGDLSRFERRDGEVLLKQEVLGHRFIDLDRSALVRAHDIRLRASTEGWKAHALDVHKYRWFHFGAHANHPARDWHAFLPLIGSQKSLKTHFALRRIQSLKAAQIADIIEGASVQEQDELLAEVHADPELEADVFEELDENEQYRLLKTRSDQDVADVLSRMRADDAAEKGAVGIGEFHLRLVGETQHAFQWAALGSGLHRRNDFVVSRRLAQFAGQVDYRHIGSRHPERHASQLFVQFGDYFAHGLGCAGGRRDDVFQDAAAAAPVLVGWAVHGLL